jgi:pyridinium-3,5-biscarboxylic acid mononucleotide sulfurtransferase
MPSITQKIKNLHAVLRSLKSGLIAVSGGVDSCVLLALAADTHDFSAHSVTVHSPAHSPGELETAAQLSRRCAITHHVLFINEINEPLIRNNDTRRCYHCKFFRYTKLLEMARSLGLHAVLDGSNADDQTADRPGITAVRELNIHTPLMDAGLTKDEIRTIARMKGLSVWNKPANACFYTRIPVNEPLEDHRIDRIARGEQLLIDSGFDGIRLRDHGSIARIELPPDAIRDFLAHPQKMVIISALKHLGYRYVCVDIEGYRTGSVS